jgi:pimeloyl-ACP methyl ester carboxylesterase
VAPLLDDRCRLVLPDLLGRGDSPVTSGARFGLTEEIARLRALLRALPPSLDDAPWMVLGHSHGAALALALARNVRVRGLVLLSPVTPWTRRPPILRALDSSRLRGAIAPFVAKARIPITRWILRRRVFADPDDVKTDTVRRYAAPFASSARARTLLRILADWHPAELHGRLPGARMPVRVLIGSRDRRIRRADARRLAERLGTELVLVDDAAHALPEERPERVASAVLQLVDQTTDEIAGGT